MTDGILGNAQRKEELMRKIEELKNEEIIPEVEMGEYIYGKIEDMLVEACLEYPPDFEKIKGLFALKPDINMVLKDALYENMVYDIMIRYTKINKPCDVRVAKEKDGLPEADCRYLPQIVTMFIENGFDAKGNDKKAWFSKLLNSTEDKYIIEACNILLKANI